MAVDTLVDFVPGPKERKELKSQASKFTRSMESTSRPT